MAAMISFCFDLAYVENGRWVAREAGLTALCQEVSDQVAEECPSWITDRDNWLAAQVADVLLGKVRALNGPPEGSGADDNNPLLND